MLLIHSNASPFFSSLQSGQRQEHSALIWTTEEDDKEVRYDGDPLTGLRRRFFSERPDASAPEDLL